MASIERGKAHRRARASFLALVLIASPGVALAQTGSLAPATIAFGEQTVTTASAPQAITIANTHASTGFQVNGVASNNPLRFMVVGGGTCGTTPFALAAGQACTVQVHFMPDVTGNHFATFSVSGTTPTATFTPVSVTLSGTGTAVPATLSPGTMDFGPQTVTTTSATRAITIANTHGSAPLQVTGHASNNPLRFAVVNGGSCGTVPFSLQAGQSCTVLVAFGPDVTGNHFATFTISGTTPATTFTPISVAISGVGTAVPATLAPASLSFGGQTVTTAAAPRSVTIANTHDVASIQINGINSNNATRFPLAAGGSCAATPFSLEAGQSCTIRVGFNPDVTGNHFATISVSGTTPATTFTPISVSASGTGTAVPIVLAPDSLAFGEVHVFATSEPQTIAIGNAAMVASVTINSTSLNNPRFVFRDGGTCAQLPFAIPPGGSCTIAVAFRPDVTGNHFATFSITGTTPQSSAAPISVSLNGLGTPDMLFTDGFESPSP